jgi:hypothetical protein
MIASLIVALVTIFLYLIDEVEFDRVWKTAMLMIIFGLLDHKNIQIAVSLLKHIGNFKTPDSDFKLPNSDFNSPNTDFKLPETPDSDEGQA